MNRECDYTQPPAQFSRQVKLKPSPQVSSTTNAIVRLLEARPLIFWGGLWMVMVLVVVAAVGSLLSPSWVDGGTGHVISSRRDRQAATQVAPLKSEVAPPQIVATNALPKASPSAAQSASRQHLPFWWFGAILFSCIAGSAMLSRVLQRPRELRRKGKPTARRMRHAPLSEPLVATLPSMATDFYRQLPARPSAPAVAKVRRVKPAPQRADRNSNRRLSHAAVAATRAMPPRVIVSVVPAEEIHPLDWQASSLAESVDLRKRHSLSSWL